jgi:hypothetical protein
MAKLGAQVAENADKVVRKVALAADQIVVLATPVDTGRARANWIASLDAASSDVKDGPSSPGAGANEALQQARSSVKHYDGDRNASVHITNNLPYISKLNDGSSAQAPANFVRTAVQAAIAVVKGARIVGEVSE